MCPDKGAAEQVVVSGILPILALSLCHRGPLTLLTAKLVAQLAKEREFPAVWRWSAFFSGQTTSQSPDSLVLSGCA